MSITAKQLAELMPDATQVESDEPEMESSLHYLQLALLVSCLEWLWRDRDDFFIGANLTIYYNRQQLKSKDFRGPDFFLVKQTQKRPRKSWVTLVPTPEEAAEQESRRAKQLAAQLRALGVEPEV